MQKIFQKILYSASFLTFITAQGCSVLSSNGVKKQVASKQASRQVPLGEVAPPTPIGVLPTEAQLAWQDLERYVFFHFGLNTYNDLEWGFGNTPRETFNPPRLDVDQWVETVAKAGFKGAILTAKHHDGFCLWPTKTTDYNISNTPYKNGKGDLVGELSKAVHDRGLLFGLYLSPWDRNSKYYGEKKYVDDVFHKQIKELTTHYGKLFEYWFDGANGGTGYYGGKGGKRSIDPASYYRYADAVEIVKKNNPDVMIFGGTHPTIRWAGNEHGEVGMTNWLSFSPKIGEKRGFNGDPEAPQYLPPECDVSIRPGWFYHAKEDDKVKDLKALRKIYYESVGRGANLLLNMPIDLEGRIPQKDSINLQIFHHWIEDTFSHNLLEGAKVSASNNRGGAFYQAENLLDGDKESYWATADGISGAELEVELPEERALNVLELKEYLRLGQRIEGFAILYVAKDGSWKPVETTEEMTTIGHKRLIPFKPIKTKRLKITLRARRSAPVVLAQLGAYWDAELN